MSQSIRRPKGSVGVQSNGGYLRLSLPRHLFGGKQRFISLGLPDTEENRQLADAKAMAITADIRYERFDYSLERYSPSRGQNLSSVSELTPQLTIKQLWDAWCCHQSNRVAPTTYQKQLRGEFQRAVDLAEDLELTPYSVSRFVKTLSARYCPTTARRVLMQLERAVDYASKSGLWSGKNLFKGLGDDIVTKKRVVDESEFTDDSYIAFTKEERDIIIDAYYNHPTFHKYAHFVKFLFLTGCRPGEAIALRWGDIRPDFTAIRFCRSYDTKTRITKETKTGESRVFRCGKRLSSFLESMFSMRYQSDSPVFTNSMGGLMNWQSFCYSWFGEKDGRRLGIVHKLVEQGKVHQYLKPYSTRHTFITLQLHAGVNPRDVAKQCGNSPSVIQRHYSDVVRNLTLPEV